MLYLLCYFPGQILCPQYDIHRRNRLSLLPKGLRIRARGVPSRQIRAPRPDGRHYSQQRRTRQGSDGFSRHQFPLGHRRGIETSSRETYIHPPADARRERGALENQPARGQTRPGYQSDDHRQETRWIFWCGHHECVSGCFDDVHEEEDLWAAPGSDQAAAEGGVGSSSYEEGFRGGSRQE